MVVWAIKHFQHYLYNHFTIVTDHSALKWLKTCKIPKGRHARWIMELQQHHFTIEHRAGKANANADALSRMYKTEITCFMAQIEEIETEEEYQGDSETEESDTSIVERIDMNYPLRKCRKLNKGHEIHYYQCQTPSTQSEDPREVTSEELEIDDYDKSDNYGRWENSSSEIGLNEPLEILCDDEVITTTYIYSREDLLQLYLSNIKLKQVIANQLITRGGSRCTNACDKENHHVHTYCTQCKKNLFYETIVHDCNWGLEEGQVHPEMDSKALVNHPW